VDSRLPVPAVWRRLVPVTGRQGLRLRRGAEPVHDPLERWQARDTDRRWPEERGHWAFNAATGRLVWDTLVGPGSADGGALWGTAADGSQSGSASKRLYAFDLR
jgi:hypothetical protein